MPAFYPENRPLTSCVLSVRRRRDYHYNDTCFCTSVWYLFTLDGILSDILMCQNGIKSDGRRCQKGIESTCSMTVCRVVRWIRPPPKVQVIPKKWASLVQIMPLLWASFPWVLLGFLHIFPNKKPLSSGFLKSYLIAFSDSHFGITTSVSLPHSISTMASSDNARRSTTK